MEKDEEEIIISNIEVGLDVSRYRNIRRNSWAEIYHNNTVLRKSSKLMGIDVIMHEWLEWRVKWSQRGIGLFSLLGLICFIAANGNVGLRVAAIVFGTVVIIIFGVLLYKNISLVVVKRLLKEPNVVFIIMLSVYNFIMDVVQPRTPLSPIMGALYSMLVTVYIFMDAINLKSRIIVIVLGIAFTILNFNNIYNNTFGSWNKGVVLIEYTIQGTKYIIMKRSVQRSIFMQIVLFSISGIYTVLKDEKIELLAFATGNIYRETGTASKGQTEITNLSTRRTKSKMNEGDDDSTNMTDIEPHKALSRVNSWAEIYHNNSTRRKSLKLMGKDIGLDDWLDWRVKWGQRGAGLFGFFGIVCHVLSAGTSSALRIATMVFVLITLCFCGVIYYKNVSFVIVKRLLKETNVVVIVVLTICNWIMEIGRPMTQISPLMGFLYMLIINAFVFIDAIKLKSRIFVLMAATLSTLLNLFNIYGVTFTHLNNGIVCFDYTIQGENYKILKRSIQRSIFLQILLFSVAGIYVVLKDQEMKLFVFATGNIYRETGTASKEVLTESFAMKRKREPTM